MPSWRWAKVCPRHVELILEINKIFIVASRWFIYYLTYIDDARSNTNQLSDLFRSCSHLWFVQRNYVSWSLHLTKWSLSIFDIFLLLLLSYTFPKNFFSDTWKIYSSSPRNKSISMVTTLLIYKVQDKRKFLCAVNEE